MFFNQKHLSKHAPIYKKFVFGTKNKKAQPMKFVQRNWLSDEIREGFLFCKIRLKNWSSPKSGLKTGR